MSDSFPEIYDKVEHENVQVRYVNFENGHPENVFAGLNALEHQNHEGVIRGIEEELAKVGIVLDGDPLVFITANRMVFLCLDGASVNMGKYNSVKAVLAKRYTWLIVIYCINHNLELAIGDLRKHDADYLNFDETMRDIYSMFHFSIKKSREILKVANELEEEFVAFNSLQTIRWLASQFRAVEKIYKNYSILCPYLEHASVAKDKNEEDKARARGIYSRVTSLKFALWLNFLMDFLPP